MSNCQQYDGLFETQGIGLTSEFSLADETGKREEEKQGDEDDFRSGSLMHSGQGGVAGRVELGDGHFGKSFDMSTKRCLFLSLLCITAVLYE